MPCTAIRFQALLTDGEVCLIQVSTLRDREAALDGEGLVRRAIPESTASAVISLDHRTDEMRRCPDHGGPGTVGLW